MRFLKHSAVALGAIALATVFAGSAQATVSIIQDGTFQNHIGTGLNLTPWADWTSVGIYTQKAPVSIGGNAAAIPFGGDLFQRFSPLKNGKYLLSFYASNDSRNDAALVFSFQQAFGIPVATTFPLGLGQELHLSASSSFQPFQMSFNINSQIPFPVNEFYFSNSYNNPEPIISDSINPRNTVIKIANVSLQQITSGVPEPATWSLMILGFGAIGATMRRVRKMKTPIVCSIIKRVTAYREH